MNRKLFYPRTPADYRYLDGLIHVGVAVNSAFGKMANENWRSEVITVEGNPHCACCLNPITNNVCFECRQTRY